MVHAQYFSLINIKLQHFAEASFSLLHILLDAFPNDMPLCHQVMN